MIEKYYYLRKAKKDGNHRCGIVYIILDKDDGARGVSLCNGVEDRFLRDHGYTYDKENKEYVAFEGGLSIARKRALSAIKTRKNGAKIRRSEAKDKVAGYGIEYKSEWAPMFNDFELKILEGARK